jgi:transcriptional regulator with GAF, ATPase, and Fis domain
MPEAPSQRPAELVIRSRRWTCREPLGDRALVLGRSEDCDVPVPDAKLSRRHCRVLPAPDGEGWLAEDLGSRTGTLLDGLPLTAPAALRPGSRLQLGSTTVEVHSRLDADLAGRDVPGAGSVELLLRTVGEIYGAESLDELLRTIVDRTIRVAGADRGALLLAGPGGGLEVVLARDRGGSDLPPDQSLTRSIPGHCLQTGRAVVLTDVEAPPAGGLVPESVLRGGLRSVVCVPLPGAPSPGGVLYVDSRRSAEDFDPAALAVFEALAVHGALAIERARYREQLARSEHAARQRLESEIAALRGQLGAAAPIGQSEPMRRLLETVQRIAPSDATVCIGGETGTGKEVIARHLHRLSPRARGPFVVVDCGAVPETLIESELFGHEKGAYTGAAASHRGRFREADGGTVFLDEIGELPLSLQPRLLRVLQERTVQPLGGAKPVPVDVRILCATNRDLGKMVAEGRFRQDLYYRLGLLSLELPPLRKRGEDVLLLARQILARLAAAHGVGLTAYTREAHEALLAHPWPGNVRELEQRVQRAVLLATPPFVTRADLGLAQDGAEPPPGPIEAELPQLPLQEARAEASERFERAYLERSMQRSGGNVSRAAALAGVSRQTFHALLRRHEMDRRSFEASADGSGRDPLP